MTTCSQTPQHAEELFRESVQVCRRLVLDLRLATLHDGSRDAQQSAYGLADLLHNQVLHFADMLDTGDLHTAAVRSLSWLRECVRARPHDYPAWLREQEPSWPACVPAAYSPHHS